MHASLQSTNCKCFTHDVQQVTDAISDFIYPFALHKSEGKEFYCVSAGSQAQSETEQDFLNYIMQTFEVHKR